MKYRLLKNPEFFAKILSPDQDRANKKEISLIGPTISENIGQKHADRHLFTLYIDFLRLSILNRKVIYVYKDNTQDFMLN